MRDIAKVLSPSSDAHRYIEPKLPLTDPRFACGSQSPRDEFTTRALAATDRYLQAFSPAVRDIFESFEFHTQIDKLVKSGLLYIVIEKFANIDLRRDVVRVAGNDEGDAGEGRPVSNIRSARSVARYCQVVQFTTAVNESPEMNCR